MADNLFMSDYQKIIFANNINENNINGLNSNGQSINNIRSLSKAYPFVVFFTKYSGNETKGEEIDNIWIDGVRATRFVGVDPTSSITIGDRTIKLNFNYETGLLSFKDANQLKRVTLKAYGFKPITCDINNLNESDYSYTEYFSGNEISINAIDNKFKLIFEFEVEDDADISFVSKSLSISSINTTTSHFNIINGATHVTTAGNLRFNNTSTIKCYAFEYQILYDTERFPEQGDSYNAISQYDSSKKYPENNGFKLILRLNPINYDIILNNTGAKVINNIDLKANTEYPFTVNIYPNGNSNYTYPVSDGTYKILELVVESTNTNYVKVINSSLSSFTLKTLNATNSIIPINVKLKNYSLLGPNYTYYITKKFNINLGGGSIYFYCGYIKPTSESTFINLMEDITNRVSNKDLNPLYDWNNNDWDIEDNVNKDFYIAFTEGYEDIILPCWDCYINSGSFKKYLPIEVGNTDNDTKYRFNKLENDIPSGITVYKSSVKGKFFGKIQIQNN